MAEHFSSAARASAGRSVRLSQEIRGSKQQRAGRRRTRDLLGRAIDPSLRYSAEPLEQRVMLSAHTASGSQYPELVTTTNNKAHPVHGTIDTSKFATATAIPIAPVSPIESGGSPTSPIVNGVVYSNMAQTGLSFFSNTSGVIANDDYNSINDFNITLTQMKFIGGVTVAGGTLNFEFFDAGANFVTGFSVSLGTAGDFIWTLTPASPPTIPDQGFLQIEAAAGTTGHWYRGTTEPSVGTQTGGTPAFRFEFTNTSPNQAPTVGSLTDTPDPVAVNGTITLTANSVVDPDGSVSQVNFYRESNGLSGLQVGGDTLLGSDTTAPYSIPFDTTGLPAGYYKYYATGVDNTALEGAAASTQNTIGFGTVTGTKWNDLNNNGVFDGGEPGMSGVTVFVDYNDNGTLDGGEPSAVTAANGTYTINNVTPGSYIVREVVPAGSTQTSPGPNGAILDQTTATSEPLDPTPIYDTPVPNDSTTASGGPKVLPIWAPGTPQKTVDDYFAKQQAANPIADLLSGVSPFTFNDGDRWSRTATNGSGLVQGQPVTLTWHVVADGTPIPALGGIGSESSSASNLQAFLNGIYGSSATWIPLFNQIFNEWSTVTGINYVMEAADDGSSFSNLDSASTQGVLGVRADIRIGGHFIDGNSNVLAYDFFPNVSDMVIDTGDNFFSNNAGGGNLGIRNVLAHEHGHGLGLQHVEPVDQTKLMEPFVSFAFDGPQPDDILAANRGYGDPLEKGAGNDTAANATNLGALNSNGTTTQNGVSIDDDSDVDFYKFTTVAAKRATITVNPVGTTYLSGTQGGPAPTPFDASSQSDLTVQLIASDGVTVLKTANIFPAGYSEQIFSAALGAGGQYFIKVTGAANAAQMYQLQVQIQNAAAGGTSVYAGPGATVSNVNFGNHLTVVSGGIAGQVYEDRNGDGAFNGLDVAMNGVTVWLDNNNNQINDDGNAVTTSGSGNFSFTGLAAGTYHLREAIPAGYVAVNPAGGATDVVVAASTVNQNLGNFPITFGGSGSGNTFVVSLLGGTTTQIVSTVNPSSAVTYTIPKATLGTSALTFNGGAANDALTVDMSAGNPVTSGGVTFNADGQSTADTLTYIGTTGADTANFNNGVVGGTAPITHGGSVEAITYDGNGGNDNVSLNGGPTVTFPTSQHFASLNITGGLAVLGTNGSRFISTASLLISGTGRLDLKDNDLIARGGSVGSFSGGFYNGITGLVAAGRNGGAWNGTTGIITTSATGNLTTLAVATFKQAKNLVNPTDTTTYAGETVTGTDVLVKFTYGGDANLDGKINVDDYGRIDSSIPLGIAGWFNGDFNYDGKINVDDYGIIDSNIGIQGLPL